MSLVAVTMRSIVVAMGSQGKGSAWKMSKVRSADLQPAGHLRP